MSEDAVAGTSASQERGQQGSAYIIALLALVVLSIIGLGLALITQTEMQVGANDVTMQRVIYAADSGVSRATAQTVSKFDCRPASGSDFELWDLDSSSLVDLREQGEISAVLPVADPPCPLCMINNAGGSGEYGAQIYFDVHHALTADAQRLQGNNPEPTARKAVSAFLSLQPWPQIPDCYGFAHTADAEKVKL
jgi:hypothetical protein